MKDFKGRHASKNAHLCHYCGGRKDKGRVSLKKKATKLVVGHYYGPRWFGYPDLSRLNRSK
jgi:hypothetical protein